MATAARDQASDGDSYMLRERLEALPQELYDMIYDLTFTAEAKIRLYSRISTYYGKETCAWLREVTKPYSEQFVTVNETSQLFHVDRASRKKFAQSYYGNPGSIFILCRNWIPEDKTHLKLIKDLRLGVPVPTTSSPLGIGWAGWMMECTEVFEGSITFMNGETIETLLKERAGIANSPCA